MTPETTSQLVGTVTGASAAVGSTLVVAVDGSAFHIPGVLVAPVLALVGAIIGWLTTWVLNLIKSKLTGGG